MPKRDLCKGFLKHEEDLVEDVTKEEFLHKLLLLNARVFRVSFATWV